MLGFYSIFCAKQPIDQTDSRAVGDNQTGDFKLD